MAQSNVYNNNGKLCKKESAHNKKEENNKVDTISVDTISVILHILN